METFEWLAPQPLWDKLDLSDVASVRGPVIGRFSSDDFMERFLGMIGSGKPWELDRVDSGPLYLPFHGHFHLVIASLVCNRLGFPDRALNAKENERVGFVLRRVDGVAAERAWVPGSGWVAIAANELANGEEILPLARAAAGERSVWHGFLPLAAGETIGSGENVESKFGADLGATSYQVRCVYLRPGCRHERALLSEPSVVFETSTFLDPKAPHRPVEIALDFSEGGEDARQSVTFKLKHDVVGLPGRVIDKLVEDLPFLKKTGLDCSSPSLSIPWITLVAFILLMILTAILWPIFVLVAFPLSRLLPSGSLCAGSPGIPEPPQE